MFELLPPALILLFGALLVGPLRGHWRTAVVLIAPLITLWAVWQVPDGVSLTLPFLGYEIEPIEGSALRRLFATVFALMAFVGGLYAFRQARWYELAAGYAYAAGAIGVCFAGDLITLFLFWELMALFSTVIVWCGGTPSARAAGVRYAILHLLGGVILKVGIEGVYVHTGSLDIRPMLATNFDTAVGVYFIGDYLAAIKSRQPPGSVITGHRYVHTDLDGFVPGTKCERRKP